MKCQSLFSGKTKKNISKVCLLKSLGQSDRSVWPEDCRRIILVYAVNIVWAMPYENTSSCIC